MAIVIEPKAGEKLDISRSQMVEGSVYLTGKISQNHVVLENRCKWIVHNGVTMIHRLANWEAGHCDKKVSSFTPHDFPIPDDIPCMRKTGDLEQWFGRIIYDTEGIVKEREFKTQAEAEAYQSGADDMMSLSDESLCDCDPLDDHSTAASNVASIYEDNVGKCFHPKCEKVVDVTVQKYCDDHGGVICGL